MLVSAVWFLRCLGPAMTRIECHHCRSRVACHAYIEDIFSRKVNFARLDVEHDADVRDFIQISTFRPDYFRIILNSPHSLYYSQYLFRNNRRIGASLNTVKDAPMRRLFRNKN